MTDVLLISDSTNNIDIAWRHFFDKDYNASATVSYEAAMDTLRKKSSTIVAVYYCGSETNSFTSFYRLIRGDKKTASIPLVILADVKWIKALSEYLKLENSCVLSITVGEAKLAETIRRAARDGLDQKPDGKKR